MQLDTLIKNVTVVTTGDHAPDDGRRLDLGIVDRRFGYPLETVLAAAQAGWRVVEVDVTYRRRTLGGRSKVSGSVRGTLRVLHDFTEVLRRRRRPRAARAPVSSEPRRDSEPLT